MAARGSIAKEEIINKILDTFIGSFINGKEVRIPWREGGEDLQIKVTLTAAKDVIDNPNEVKNFSTPSGGFPVMSDPIPETPIEKEPSAEEKANLRLLINKLGL